MTSDRSKSRVSRYSLTLKGIAATVLLILGGYYAGWRGYLDPIQFHAFAAITASLTVIQFYLERKYDDIHDPEGAVTAREFWFGGDQDD